MGKTMIGFKDSENSHYIPHFKSHIIKLLIHQGFLRCSSTKSKIFFRSLELILWISVSQANLLRMVEIVLKGTFVCCFSPE